MCRGALFESRVNLTSQSQFNGNATKNKNYMRLIPITRRELIKRLRNLGWDGPFPGGKHQYMVRGAMKLPIPNPHGGVLSVAMVSEILKETGTSREEWLSAN